MTNIDSIVLGSSARNWFRKQGVMPSTWPLKEVERTRILKSEVQLCVFNSPACNLKLSEDVRRAPPAAVVAVDAYQVEDWIKEGKFTGSELTATLLHEIGHTVNPQHVSDWRDSDDFEADDYVRHCGLSNDLLSALGKLKEFDRRCNSALTEQRMKRIQDNAELRLKSLRFQTPP